MIRDRRYKNLYHVCTVCLFAYEGTVRHLEAKSRTQYQGEKRILKKRFCDDWKDEIQIRLYTKMAYQISF